MATVSTPTSPIPFTSFNMIPAYHQGDNDLRPLSPLHVNFMVAPTGRVNSPYLRRVTRSSSRGSWGRSSLKASKPPNSPDGAASLFQTLTISTEGENRTRRSSHGRQSRGVDATANGGAITPSIPVDIDKEKFYPQMMWPGKRCVALPSIKEPDLVLPSEFMSHSTNVSGSLLFQGTAFSEPHSYCDPLPLDVIVYANPTVQMDYGL